MKPISKLITRVDEEDSDDDEQGNWPSLPRLANDDEEREGNYNEEEDEENDYKVHDPSFFNINR
jgi:hypothetical protein